ncbi:MAG: hypothetical protein U0353_27440 [Sandaracinus sp.]
MSDSVANAVRAVERLAPLAAHGPSPAVPPLLRLASVKAAWDGVSTATVSGGVQSLGETVAQLGSPLGMASLGIGLANLGVGVYNAYQIGKVREEVSAMHSEMALSFRSIQTVLDVQSRQLAVLLDGQSRIGSQVDALRREMLAGFSGVLDTLGDIESRRRAEDLQVRSLKVTGSWRVVLEAFADEEKPSDNDIRRLGDSSLELQAWADTALTGLPAGSPARLPYFVAKALSVRAASDAKQIEAGTLAKSYVRQIEQLIVDLEDEVRAAANGKTLYEVGVTLGPVIAQYVALRRGLKTGISAPTTSPVEAAPSWDDGLADLRLLASNLRPQEAASATVPLGTLSDMQWYLEWTGEDPRRTDLRRVHEVSLRAILRRLGAPPGLVPPSPAAVPALLMLALPKYRDQAQDRLNREFQWKDPARLVHGEPMAAAPQPTAEGASLDGRVVRFGGLELVLAVDESNGGRYAALYKGGANLGTYEATAPDPWDEKQLFVRRASASKGAGAAEKLPKTIHIAFTGGDRVRVKCVSASNTETTLHGFYSSSVTAPSQWTVIRRLSKGEGFCLDCREYYSTTGTGCPRCQRNNASNLSSLNTRLCVACALPVRQSDPDACSRCGDPVVDAW